MSPEILDRKDYTLKTDLFSFGLVMFQLITLYDINKIGNVYREIKKNVNYVTETLEKVEKVDNKLLIVLIYNCLKIDYNERPNVFEISEIIQQHQIELFSKKKKFSFKIFGSNNDKNNSLFSIFDSRQNMEDLDNPLKSPLSSRRSQKSLSEVDHLLKANLKISDFINEKSNEKTNNEKNDKLEFPFNLSDIELLEILKFITNQENGFSITDRNSFLQTFKFCFIAEESVECLYKKYKYKKEECKKLLNMLIDIGVVKHVIDSNKNFKSGKAKKNNIKINIT
jgi:hypothetical protein